MKPFKERIKKLDLVPFPYEVQIIVSTDPQKSRIKRSNILGHYTWDPETTALHSSVDGRSYVFFKEGADIGVIAHEMYHVLHRLMEFVGAKHENEIMAYFMGHLVRETAIFTYSPGWKSKRKAKDVGNN